MEIARRNIFDEIIGRAGSTYESAILTCFSFDPLYFMQYYLPKLNAINITNIVVLIDAGQYDEAWEEFIKYKESAHRSVQLNFSPVRISPSFHGVFHPKIALLVGPRQCTALVGSGNLTYGGMTYNNEVWNAFSANRVDAEEAPVIAEVWHYLRSLIPEQNTVREQIAWMTAYSDCLKLIDTISEPGSSRLLVNTDVAGIGNQVLSIIRNEPVKEITIVSPYYDNTGSAIAFFSDNLHPDRIVCLGDEETGTWPVSLREGVMERVDFRAIKGKELETRTHAKIIQIHTDKSTYLLSGSANATSAGLGLSSVKNSCGNLDLSVDIGDNQPEADGNHHACDDLLIAFPVDITDTAHGYEIPEHHGGADHQTAQQDVSAHQVQFAIDHRFDDMHHRGGSGFACDIAYRDEVQRKEYGTAERSGNAQKAVDEPGHAAADNHRGRLVRKGHLSPQFQDGKHDEENAEDNGHGPFRELGETQCTQRRERHCQQQELTGSLPVDLFPTHPYP